MNDLPDLAFFALLARQPTLAAAAQALGVTPSSVSRRLAALEHRLGVRLLHRTTRRISLSAEGSRYLEGGEQILHDLDNLERSLLGSREMPRGLLRINATFGFGRRHLAPALSDFARRYPDVEVILDLTDRPAMKQLLDEQIEVCREYLAHVKAGPQESPFQRLVALSKTSAAEATLGWLESHAQDLKQEN